MCHVDGNELQCQDSRSAWTRVSAAVTPLPRREAAGRVVVCERSLFYCSDVQGWGFEGATLSNLFERFLHKRSEVQGCHRWKLEDVIIYMRGGAVTGD